MHIAKFNLEACGHVCAHFERKPAPGHYSNKSIDDKRTGDNYNIGPTRDCTQIEYIKKSLEEISHLKRDNLTVMASVIVNKPADLAVEYQEKFFRESYNFLVKRFCGAFTNPEDGVVSCYVHLDETTPHIHFAFLPVKNKKMKNGETKKRFCSKELITRDNLATLHQDLQEYLNKECNLRCKILTGTTQRDAYGRALSVRELKKQTAERERNRSIDRTIGGRW